MIEVWIVKFTDLLTTHQYYSLLSNLPVERQQQLQKFHFQEDAQRSLIGDIIVQTLISEHLSLPKQNIILEKKNFGKPFLRNYPNFYFNVSHSGEYVTCAVSNHSIGIDIEIIKPIDLTLASRFFTNNENEYINTGQSNLEQQHRFYSIWTRKEAYIKLYGRGLSIPLNSFDVLNFSPKNFYLCIQHTNHSVCHICTEQKEEPVIRYSSFNFLLFFYKYYKFSS